MKKLLTSVLLATSLLAAPTVFAQDDEDESCRHQARRLIHAYHEECREDNQENSSLTSNHHESRFCRGEHAFAAFLFLVCGIEDHVEEA